MDFDLNEPLRSDDFDNTVEYSGNSSNHDELLLNDPESILLSLEKSLEVGSTVETLEQVYLFYCEYARMKGFSVKKGCQAYFRKTDEIRMKEYHCSCEGKSDQRRSVGKLASYKKQITRCGCKARIRVVRDIDSQWKVCRFYKEHNHELVPAEQSYLLRSARHLSHAKKSILEAMTSAGISVSRACRFMEKECGGPQNVGFTRKDAYAHMQRKRMETRIDNADANALLRFFINKSNNEPFFYWNVQTDDDGRLMNFFFRDSRSAIDYEYFGDVVSVDTTYRTNKYNLICAPFVGINHHMRNVMFGLAFLSDETTRSFDWLFQTFLESMHGKEPQVIFSDQCQAMMNGVDYTFRTAKHRLCQWHINQNAPSHFGSLNGNTAFKKLWFHCMNGCETAEEFEESWQNMMQTYELSEKKWFKNMYKLRQRWASVFSNDCFSAGLHATSRSEVTNKVLKDLCTASCSLNEFVLQYEQIINDWRTREAADDAKCIGIPGQFIPDNRLLMHAAEVYTRNVYKSFESEAALSLNIDILSYPDDNSVENLEYIIMDQSSSSRTRCVVFNVFSHAATCTCHMWETEGVLCRHILKIYFLKNVKCLPDCYILKRWSKIAKERMICNFRSDDESALRDNVKGMVFVNHIMRTTYEIAQEAKLHSNCRTLILDRFDALRKEVMTLLNGVSSDHRKKRAVSYDYGDYKGVRFCNPPVASTRGLSTRPRRHWDVGKDKKKKSVGRQQHKSNFSSLHNTGLMGTPSGSQNINPEKYWRTSSQADSNIHTSLFSSALNELQSSCEASVFSEPVNRYMYTFSPISNENLGGLKHI